jgi:hypothetical protein
VTTNTRTGMTLDVVNAMGTVRQGRRVERRLETSGWLERGSLLANYSEELGYDKLSEHRCEQ